MNQKYADSLLLKTKENYEIIAPDFSQKRARLTHDFKALKKYANPGEKILDLGCGSGRLSDLFANTQYEYMGADNCSAFIEWAKANHPDKEFRLLENDLTLPFRNGAFDVVYSLAVLHHIPSEKYRVAYLKEIKKVLNKDGRLVITVWNLWTNKKANRRIFKANILKTFGLSKMDYNDFFLPFHETQKHLVVARYLHAFTKNELKGLLEKAGFALTEMEIVGRGEKVRNENIQIVAVKR